MHNRQVRHEEKELRAFKAFAGTVDLGIVMNSIQKRDPPEPDILCRLENGSHVAFELVEILNPRNAAFVGGAPRLSALIEDAYNQMPPDLKQKFDARFVNSPISFRFQASASQNLIKSRLPTIMAEIANQNTDDDQNWEFSDGVRKVLASARRRGRVDVSGRPSFNIAGEFSPEDDVVRLILGKMSKTYQSDHPIELPMLNRGAGLRATRACVSKKV
jgi:hypothetical protein